MSLKPTPITSVGAAPPGRRLESWKEIAAYLGRDVTTVRRWEKREGLPVHRLHHSKLGSIYAFTAELDSWREERAPAVAADAMDTHPNPDREAVRHGLPVRTVAGLTVLALILAVGATWIVHERTIKPTRASGGIRSLAVLPLQNFSGNPEQTTSPMA